MAEYDYVEMDGLTYSVPKNPKPRKKAPPLVVVMNQNCTSCSGSPACMLECPVDCIHLMYDHNRPVRVYVDNQVCIGCMNCLSDTYRPGNIMKGDIDQNIAELNRMDLAAKSGVCPWDAIQLQRFDEGAMESYEHYTQPRLRLEEEAGSGSGNE